MCFVADLQMLFVELGVTTEGFSHSLDEYSEALNEVGAQRTESCVLHEQKVYAGQEFGTQKELFNSFVLIQRESDGKKEM